MAILEWSLNYLTFVPIVQRIERLPSKEQIEVRFLVGTQYKINRLIGGWFCVVILRCFFV